MMFLSPGAKLGPYEILAPIGAGGMGEVFRARDTRLRREVAIKDCAENFGERFEREARVVASLNHPNYLHSLRRRPQLPAAEGSRPGTAHGKALLYFTADLKAWSVDVALSPSLRIGTPKALGSLPAVTSGDVAPDGKRILAEIPPKDQELAIGVVANWPALRKE